MYKILIIEDDKQINDLLKQILENSGYETASVYTGLEAQTKLRETKVDMILLDLMLPFISGDRILVTLRETSQIPVIVISAKETTQMKVDLLRLGADDYITKPFDNEEILARIETLFRRYGIQSIQNKKYVYKDLEMDLDHKSVKISQQDVSLTATEYKLLEALIGHPKKVFSKDNLFEHVWGEAMPEDDNTLNVHMSRLRHKLKDINPNQEYIETLWGLGYRLCK